MHDEVFNRDDLTVKQAAIVNLGRLKETPQASEALDILLEATEHDAAFIRASAARILECFGGQQAQAALAKLQQDSSHRVVRVALEGLL